MQALRSGRESGGNAAGTEGTCAGSAGHAASAAPAVLVVEDDSDVRAMMEEMLRDLDCRVLSATSGEAALALLDQHTVRVAVVDQALPGMAGQDFVARARGRAPDLRAVYVSGTPIDGQGDAVLLKPFRAAQFHAAVSALLTA
ncbi:response regulator [Acidisphaera rubrifaciens]|uniref:Integral membrane sensor hybrid histidine kinase n=1 Tax=Acidisphaera rubrifaciens HS-AP3 TaxID=1231350 RepID=A0A0D6P8W3_9PROT|nr:response regulator [Acidisphaera rubrifaciens]GAN77633.1 integral membrane sensor hybrid histidine kinase [Acidisphaera rubrifaciens HS-AP3]